MATATQIHISTSTRLEVAASPAGLDADSASKASQVLQLNHDVNDIITNDIGHHNHIVHGILTAYALGATPSLLQSRYDRNSSYQRQPRDMNPDVIARLDDQDVFLANLTPNKTEMYQNWRTFFQHKIEQMGPKDMLLHYVFADDDRARIMFSRLFAGALHPLIHTGLALEFEQPAILAEAIGQSAIHPHDLDPWFEEVALKSAQTPNLDFSKLLDKVAADPKLSKAARLTDPLPIHTSLLARAPDEMMQIASEWKVSGPEELQEKMAELFKGAAYLVGGAINPRKEIKLDFFYLHALTSVIFMPLLISQDWIPEHKKVQLLEWKGRYDLVLFATFGAPRLQLDDVTGYKPKIPGQTWEVLFARAVKVAAYEDDGHTAKFVRALYRGADLCKPYEHKPSFRIRGPMWLQLANMVLDSVEGAKVRWVRGAGFEEAWKGFADREVAAA